ncbi:SipW-dependent-type signal peptide-containing protein [Bittarella massiliensis (ex Durand et al. 2017)]|uniref:SipW-dependent-type signal peptide-containing protein n=1 Tax=Bittarella massiliensis (ex Durand et al. 2017) TaxID=1720313 RepID=UPI001AA15C6F|nr:SipW-dependent-type signal peptide-containing protein [Bittarella massiliensis (ex Durand et al. 2017)]MBO1679030.1 hypothetical protein [Bittarella massiliensis (ex Durand et al. 2017)]
MKKKNVLIAAASTLLVAMIAVGATLAYFTDTTAQRDNVFTTGKVDIGIVDISPVGTVDSKEMVVATGDNHGNGLSYTDIMPGDLISKTVGATVEEGSQPCYLAIRVTAQAEVPNSQNASVNSASVSSQLLDLVAAEVDTDKWIVSRDGDALLCYYREAVSYTAPAAGETANPANQVTLFEHFTIPGEEWDNNYAQAGFSLSVSAAAVQQKNLDAPSLIPAANTAAIQLQGLFH